jgi:hypothetical protein
MIIGFKKQFVNKILSGEKLHTIREDKHNRWKPGVKMHMATGVRTKDYNCFNETECKGIQDIEIIQRGSNLVPVIYIDGVTILKDEQIQLAKNDGFDSVEDFWNWFNKDFSGVIVHWTDFRY